MELKDKVAIVTGASSGIGQAISNAIAVEGGIVALVARSRDKLEAAKKECEKDFKGKALVVPADVSSEDEVKKAVQTVVDECGGLDIVVNNAGLGIFKELDQMSVDEWDRHINVMLRGAFLVTKYSIPQLYSRGGGHVVNVTSLWAARFCRTCSAYTAAKFGLRGFSQSFRLEARDRNVRVTDVMPGTVDTPFFTKANWETDLSMALHSEDVAKTVAFVLKLPDRVVIEEVVINSINPFESTA